MRTAYRRSLEYSISSLVSWMATYGSEDTVLIMVGDHQAAPFLTGPDAGRDVPITIIAGDQAVLDRIGDWGWRSGSGRSRRRRSGGWTRSATGS